jgi:serine/threonine protein kinase
MELCDWCLKDYIHYIPAPNSLAQSTIPCLKDTPASMRVLEIWRIMMDIVSGVKFIHSEKEVHRDLKPSNGEFSLTNLK